MADSAELMHTCSEALSRRRADPLLVIFSAFFVWYFLHGSI